MLSKITEVGSRAAKTDTTKPEKVPQHLQAFAEIGNWRKHRTTLNHE
jgi:hypothetical protein